MRRSARALLLLALALHLLAPVLAYASGAALGDLLGEHCGAEEPADHDHRHDGSADAPTVDAHEHEDGNSTTAPHCPYCPGFAAAAPLAFGVPQVVGPRVLPDALAVSEASLSFGRASLRIPQPRAPPA